METQSAFFSITCLTYHFFATEPVSHPSQRMSAFSVEAEKE